MLQAAILIGVAKVIDMPALQAVYSGVEGMREWALDQGMRTENVIVITDEVGPISPELIKKVVKSFYDRGDIEQLFVYFAGHGVNIAHNEYWLLSDALQDGDAAINVTGSIERAKYGVIPHVVFLSDACRTAATDLLTHAIDGSIMFPSPQAMGKSRSIDVFYATLLGEPSLEIADKNEAVAKYRALYTDTLLEALNGRHEDLLQNENTINQKVIRSWPLKDFLERELPMRVFQALGAADSRSQQPDAQITSRPNTWLAVQRAESPQAMVAAHEPASVQYAEQVRAESSQPKEALQKLLSQTKQELHGVLNVFRAASVPEAGDLELLTKKTEMFQQDALRNAQPIGPLHFESKAGVKLRGARVKEALADVQCELLDQGEIVRVWMQEQRFVNVLLILENGWGIWIPVIKDFLVTLTLADTQQAMRQLVDVVYEPAEHTSRWTSYEKRLSEIRSLRAVIAASSRQGMFRLEGPEIDQLARRMQVLKGIDPSLALYAAHAYRQSDNIDRIQEMYDFLKADLGLVFFDIALLARRLQALPQPKDIICPLLPLLSQSWALLPAYDLTFPENLRAVSRFISPISLWSIYRPEGVALIRQHFYNKG